MPVTPKIKKPPKLPYVAAFPDYHDIEHHLRELRRDWNGISGKELCCDYNYWGLFWETGKKPTRAEIREMLKKAGCNLDTVADEISY